MIGFLLQTSKARNMTRVLLASRIFIFVTEYWIGKELFTVRVARHAILGEECVTRPKNACVEGY